MEWTQIKVTCAHADLDEVCAVMCMLDNGLMIEDYSDIEENLMSVYGELIDDSILNADKAKCAVSIFVPEEKHYPEYIAFLKDRFNALSLKTDISIEGLQEEDWANAWRAYYQPVHIGERLVVVPAWQKYEAKPQEVTILMDPGMAFGTGTHETTRLCAAMVEKHMPADARVLDVGTGSGILSLFALKLGAKSANAYDIDPVAVRVAIENAKDNGVDNFVCGVSDLLAGVDLEGGQYDFAMANIVADILIRMSENVADYLKVGAKLVCSGIIEGRWQDVKEAMESHGLTLCDEGSENDWKVLVFTKN
ncbi:MAG: 50S ribosomal protein L11 methyltransferase [Oscillospiraceae bacterium]|nr:50S ribosomal protein L11 methyltransferase [Oscillospiraceae bacterium]